MDFLFGLIKNIEDFAKLHNVNDKTFLLIYFLSIIPIYLGYFLIFYGATREISIKKVLKLLNLIVWSEKEVYEFMMYCKKNIDEHFEYKKT